MKLLTRSVVVVTLLLLLSPVGAGAQGSAARHESFCTSQTERQASIQGRFAERLKAYETAKQTQSQNQAARQNSRSDAITNVRERADQQRSKSYDLLAGKQNSEEEKAKVRSFASEVNAAIAIRRAAYDTARASYQDTIDRLLAARVDEMTNSINEYIQKAEIVMGSASQNCTKNPDERVKIRQTLITELGKIRVNFNEKLRARSDYREVVKQAAEVRTQNFKDATQTFQQTMQKIKDKYADLKG